jgi:hypothetical protein
MLSTSYRLRLHAICEQIASNMPVTLEERIWATKLGSVNSTAAAMLRQAARRQQKPDMQDGDVDDFLNRLDIGDPEQPKGVRGFDSPESVADFFRRDKPEDWRQRD